MTERLQILIVQIPILEAKLRAMKQERRSLLASEAMRRKRQDPAFNAKALAATLHRLAAPQERQRWTAVRNNNNLLPFPNGTKERNRYRSLRRKGWTRELAISKIHADIAEAV